MKKIYLHALPVRVWHWVNALSFFVLIGTGAQIRYRDSSTGCPSSPQWTYTTSSDSC